MKFVIYIGGAIVIGMMAKLVYELYSYSSWSRLEEELEDWKQSPRGRFNAYLDGLA